LENKRENIARDGPPKELSKLKREAQQPSFLLTAGGAGYQFSPRERIFCLQAQTFQTTCE
jgi:hypothetical protein